MPNEHPYYHMVKDAMKSYHNPVRMASHRLGEVIASSQGGMHIGGERLREVLADGLEAIRPSESVPHDAQDWYPYQVVFLSYLQGSDRDAVCAEIGLSRSSYYRHLREGLEAVATVISERFEVTSDQDRVVFADSELAQREADRLDLVSANERIEVTELVDSVLTTFAPLASSRGIELSASAEQDLSPLSGSPTVWRQVMLGALSFAADHLDGKTLKLTVRQEHDRASISIGPLRIGAGTNESILSMPSLTVVARLLGRYGGKLSLTRDNHRRPNVHITGPSGNPTSLLIVDDDMDTVSLYLRYIHGLQIDVHVAGCAEEAFGLIAQDRPDVILLDVLLPREDGWQMLQHLKDSDSTSSIPVVISSVLSQPSLALSCGAAAVLQKPMTKDEMLRCLSKFATLQPSSNAFSPSF